MLTRLTVAVSAATIGTLALAGPALAADGGSSIHALKGRVLTLEGFVGDASGNWQLRVKLDKTNGQVGLGTQEWRPCTGREAACASGSGEGDGWSDPVPFRVVRTPNGSLVGSGDLGQLFVRANRGKVAGSFLGQSPVADQAFGIQARGGSGGKIVAGTITSCGSGCSTN